MVLETPANWQSVTRIAVGAVAVGAVAAAAVVLLTGVSSSHGTAAIGATGAQTADLLDARWVEQTRGAAISLRALNAVSAGVAWASGSGGTWLRTADGGATWSSAQVRDAEELDFRDIEGFDAYSACVLSIGRPATIYCTGDAGTRGA